MRMHMLRVISLDPLFADDDRHAGFAANDANYSPASPATPHRGELVLLPNPGRSDAANPAVLPLLEMHAAADAARADDYCLGGYAGI